MAISGRPRSIEDDSELMVRCPVTGGWFLEKDLFSTGCRYLCPDCSGFHALPFFGDFSQSPATSIYG